jgi:hypothetical protein
MRSWIMLGVSVLILSFAASADKAIHYTNWWLDGHYAVAQAKDALELVGIEDVDDSITVIAPSMSRSFVAGHVRTEGGTLPFSATFGGAGKDRVPVRVTVGSKTLLPSGQDD